MSGTQPACPGPLDLGRGWASSRIFQFSVSNLCNISMRILVFFPLINYLFLFVLFHHDVLALVETVADIRGHRLLFHSFIGYRHVSCGN